MKKIVFTFLIFYFVSLAQGGQNEELERHPSDGWYNNLLHPDWGAIDTHLLRRSPVSYRDGVYEPAGKGLPNPFDISRIAFNGSNNLSSERNRNALLVFFGQQLVEEIMDAQRPGCPIEYMNIPVPLNHKYNPRKIKNLEMPFLRSRYDQRTGFSPNNPRQQLNEITPYIDGNLVYGAGKAVEDTLRSFKNGELLADNNDIKKSFPAKNDIRLPYANPPSPRDHVLRPVSRFRRVGNPRTHENPFLYALQVVWFRYHNYLAREVKKSHQNYSDEQIFNAARRLSIAQYQKIVMYEWLPAWLKIDANGNVFNIREDYPYEGGGKNNYSGYDPNVHPGISTEFQAAAFRFGHTLVPPGIVTKTIKNGACQDAERDVKAKFTSKPEGGEKTQKVTGIRLCNAYGVPEETVEVENGMDDVIRGLIFTRALKEDNIIVSDLREEVFGPLDWSRRDLGALNIQRARDNGLPGYNDVRQAYGLPRKENWLAINSNYAVILSELQRLYDFDKTPDRLDVFPGGLLETVPDGPGPLFTKIILEQFLRIRHGDRFWYENRQNRLFTDAEISQIEMTTFFDVLQKVTGALDEPVNVYKSNVFSCRTISPTSCFCSDPFLDTFNPREVCVPLQHYDYFSGSDLPFILTVLAIVLSVPIAFVIMCLMAKMRSSSSFSSSSKDKANPPAGPNYFYATEWVGRTALGSLNSREVKVEHDSQRMKIFIYNVSGQVVRMIDLRARGKPKKDKSTASVSRSNDKGNRLMMLTVPGEIDVVLYFPSKEDRDDSFIKIQGFLKKHNWNVRQAPSLSEQIMWREAMTIDQRKEVLARFFKGVLAELSGEDMKTEIGLNQEQIDEVLSTRLTRTEFADALGLQPQSLFVRNLFLLVDSSGDGFVSFDECKTYFGILSSGKPEDKAKMFFKMFDTDRNGKLTKQNYKKMIMSLVEMNEAEQKSDLDAIVDAVFKQVGKDKVGYMTFEDFKSIILSNNDAIWKSAVLNLDVGGETAKLGLNKNNRSTIKDRTKSFVAGYQKIQRTTSLLNAIASQQVNFTSKPQTVSKTQFQRFCLYVDNHNRQIFWLTLYTLVTLGIFIERAYYYSFEREHAGLRRMAGYGVSVTRGAASAQMVTYASLLVTMSQNTLTFLRETFLHRFIPFDNAHDMHLYIAFLAIMFTAIHCIGHLINFYHISTQPSSDLNCYFTEYFRPTHVLASFKYWTYHTITGLTGVALVLVLVVLYVFATPFARRNVFKYFRATHNLYILVYILIFLHGHQRLVQVPLWPNFFLGPLILFVIDKLVSVSRNKVLLIVSRATLLPSGVISLHIKKPLSFNYQSGQWVRVACPVLGEGEYHPFTLTSAPHEGFISLHIRAVGPWTTNFHQLFDPNVTTKSNIPKIYLDGPFGESHQDWYRFPVSVLVGGGIGITPFASILKDIAHRSSEVSQIPCQKVYFIWVTRTQQSFEWMTEIIRQVEAADTAGFVDVHICVTQMKEKFDLRTTMLYICERHFQKIAGLSMFTGLRAKTHFGRPKFQDFFEALKIVHENVSQIGVFSCGPPSMTRSVQQSCTEQNTFKGPSLIHHFENF
ncbi:dual oxidase 2-like [Biomphalaria glabrata]|uniref:NAD(P)H oxidase (H2O2-forming) n=1 Tax=Biomphalaria glabrata TaxID=6526 RepID=A0A9W2YNE0_BIOGL|nr:dual oxidase 2-like [Biomphalaria glabrata]XP_055864179.1 dual oxidase 2-like [Biomphalaria glabrata]